MKKQMIRLFAAVFAAIGCCVSASAMPQTVIPGGCTVGVKLYTQGIVITGFENGSAAKAAGLKKGDVIVEVDGEEVHTTAALRESLEEDRVVLTVLRDGKEASFCVNPIDNQIGAYVKDSIAGIGTVTYYDPNTGAFGALGHGVCDADSEKLVPVAAGVVVRSSVAEVRKGVNGNPGELKGQFDVETILGDVACNSEKGIFGKLSTPLAGKPIPVADSSDVEVGAATILSNVSGQEVRAYEVNILKLYPNTEETGRNMLLEVTDPELLAQTGGIVQGMSGSPIIQNGKLIGAVTHVLVNDAAKGYGILIENMLDATG